MLATRKIIFRNLLLRKWFLGGFPHGKLFLWVFRGLPSIPYYYENRNRIILKRKCNYHWNSVYFFQRSSNYLCKNILGLELLVQWFYVHAHWSYRQQNHTKQDQNKVNTDYYYRFLYQKDRPAPPGARLGARVKIRLYKDSCSAIKVITGQM